MGAAVDVVVHGMAPTPDQVLERLADLERRWSRFLPDSELSRLGRAGGRPCVVSAESAQLVHRSAYGWARTGGLFDPTVVDALVAAGYDRDFHELVAATRPVPDVAGRSGPSPGMSGVSVDPVTGLVCLPQGVRVDPGGLGKGLAADIAVVESLHAGARALLISVGGDLRVGGEVPQGGWEIEVDHLLGPAMRLNLHSGALATSSVLRRRWDRGGGPAHHVIDPRTGRPSSGHAVSVSVLAAEAWWAEVVATALLVGFGEPEHAAPLSDLVGNGGAVVTTRDGARHVLGPLGDAFLRDRPVDQSNDGGQPPSYGTGNFRRRTSSADAIGDPIAVMEDDR